MSFLREESPNVPAVRRVTRSHSPNHDRNVVIFSAMAMNLCAPTTSDVISHVVDVAGLLAADGVLVAEQTILMSEWSDAGRERLHHCRQNNDKKVLALPRYRVKSSRLRPI